MSYSQLIIAFALALYAVLFSGCMSQGARTARVDRRQDRIDTRTSGRQERWATRAEREDARAAARFDSW